MTYSAIDKATAVVSGGTISKSAFGDPVCDNFADHETRIVANEVDVRTAANALTVVRGTMGRWYSTSNNAVGTKITAETGLSSWTVTGDTPSGTSVSTDTFTVAADGRYVMNANMFGTVQGTSQKGYIGFSIQNVAKTVIYAYQMCYYDQAAGTTPTSAVLVSCTSMPVKLTAGSTFKVYVYCNNTNGVVMSGDSTNQATSFGIQRVG